MKMVSFIVNFDGTFSPCSQGGEYFLAKLDREKMAHFFYVVRVPPKGEGTYMVPHPEDLNWIWSLRDADALIKYLTE
jgi:hypothetical protein